MNDAYSNFLLIGGIIIVLFFTLIHNKIIKVLKKHRELHSSSFWVSRVKKIWCNECFNNTKHMVSNSNPFFYGLMYGFLIWLIYFNYQIGDFPAFMLIFRTGLIPSSIILKLIWPLFGFIILFTLISVLWCKISPPTTKCVLCHPDEFSLYKHNQRFKKTFKFIGIIVLMVVGYTFTGIWLLWLYWYIFPPFFMQS